MHRSNQGIKGLIASQEWIHLEIVVSVIAMVGRRTKHRREVQTGHSQALEVIESTDHPIEISPLKSLL
jgi:hypothetical protein